jgi:hypothetical protein
MRMLQNKHKYNKRWLIKEVALRCHFTQKDVRQIMGALQEIIEEMVILQLPLFWSGFVLMSITRKKDFKLTDNHGNPMLVENGFRIKMTPSIRLRNLCRGGIAGDFDEEEIIEEEEDNEN